MLSEDFKVPAKSSRWQNKLAMTGGAGADVLSPAGLKEGVAGLPG